MSPWGIQAELTVSPSGKLAVAAWSIGSFIDINDTHGTTWHMIIGSGADRRTAAADRNRCDRPGREVFRHDVSTEGFPVRRRCE